MGCSDYARFVEDCIAFDETDEYGLTDDELYGLYLSWCQLEHQSPSTGRAFWSAMDAHGLTVRRRVNRSNIHPGLRMTGPAALDYILASRPSLLQSAHPFSAGSGPSLEMPLSA